MAAVADLTKTEVSAAIPTTASAVKTWWDSAEAYDAGFTTCELMLVLAQAMYIAQVNKNADANDATPLVAGEALAAYAAPIATAPIIDVATGLQIFNQTVSITGITAVNSNATVPALI